MVPLKKWPHASAWSFLAGLSWGIFLSANLVGIVTHTVNFRFPGVGSGLIWVIGGALCFRAVQKENLAGAGVRAMGMSILTSFLCGVFLFKESVFLPLSLFSLLVILFGLFLLAPHIRGFFKNWRSLCGGVIFGSYLIPFQYSDLSALEFIYSFSMGIFIGSNLLVLFLKLKNPEKIRWTPAFTFASMGAGVFWMLGTHGCFWALDGLGYAVGYPLTQLNLLVNILWGVIAFGEYPTKKEKAGLLSAALLIILGAVLLTLSKQF